MKPLDAFLEAARAALKTGVPYSQLLTSLMDLETSDEALGEEECPT